ncbi:hypothetical protein [Kitasatospora sp. NPDC058478]|uniref:hypothetical protein n=1 Tax=unclassified Kitasatospora TaxID=2633591 RepID=UPI00365CE9EB
MPIPAPDRTSTTPAGPRRTGCLLRDRQLVAAIEQAGAWPTAPGRRAPAPTGRE